MRSLMMQVVQLLEGAGYVKHSERGDGNARKRELDSNLMTQVFQTVLSSSECVSHCDDVR